MSPVNQWIDEIPSSLAHQQISRSVVAQAIKKPPENLVGYGLKKVLIFLLSLFVPLFIPVYGLYWHLNLTLNFAMGVYLILLLGIALIMLILDIVVMIRQRRLPNYYNRQKYHGTFYLLVQIGFTGFGALYSLQVFPIRFWWAEVLSLAFFLSASLWLTRFSLQTRIAIELNEHYGGKIPVSQSGRQLAAAVAGIITAFIAGLYLYRIFKGFFILSHFSMSFSWVGVPARFILLLLVIVASLVPTARFDAEAYIQAKLIQKEPELYRVLHGYSTDEFYKER